MNLTTHSDHKSAVIVGASLSGLMTAISLAQENVQVTIVDKVDEEHRSGSGLRVDGSSFNQTKTEKLLRNLASGGKSSIQLWSSIETRLREEVEKDSRIDLRFNTRVQEIGQDEECAWLKTADGEIIRGDLLIGADGHSSMVRGVISPGNPNAKFAGYIVWIASTDEADLPEQLHLRQNHPEVTMLDSYNGFIFGSIIDVGNSTDGAHDRRIGCTWYDNSRNTMLREIGCVEGTVVHHSLNGPDIPEETIQELIKEVALKWEEPWKSAMLHALENRNLTGIPIKEYVPDKLVDGRIALVGDAAHVPAPITASGFNASLVDAAELGKILSKDQPIVKALKKYEAQRLNKVRAMVQSGQSYSRSFGR